MGRGLSELQRQILTLALEKVDAGRRGSRAYQEGHPDLFISEILVALFGWEPERYHTVLGCQHFSRAAIGETGYNATMATLSRAIRRLATRNLVKRDRLNPWSKGLSLTAEGIEIARTLRN